MNAEMIAGALRVRQMGTRVVVTHMVSGAEIQFQATSLAGSDEGIEIRIGINSKFDFRKEADSLVVLPVAESD